MSVVFEFQGVSKHYGQQIVLNQLSFQGCAGEVIALLGENGAGKTTALKILLGLVTPDSGLSSVSGLNSQRQGAELRRRVGYMPDRPCLYDWMTVDEIGWFASGFYPAGYQTFYKKLIDHFELPGSKAIKTLSKGMQGKVSLALAMAHEPQLLILDEPTSGLDPVVRREFLESMVDVASTGRTVLLSSHQIAEVERVADKVAIIRSGNLILFESLEALKNEIYEVVIATDCVEVLPPTLPAGAELMGALRRDRQWQMLVKNLDQAGQIELSADSNHTSVEFRRPSLEQIYFTCMKSPIEHLANVQRIPTRA